MHQRCTIGSNAGGHYVAQWRLKKWFQTYWRGHTRAPTTGTLQAPPPTTWLTVADIFQCPLWPNLWGLKAQRQCHSDPSPAANLCQVSNRMSLALKLMETARVCVRGSTYKRLRASRCYTFVLVSERQEMAQLPWAKNRSCCQWAVATYLGCWREVEGAATAKSLDRIPV